MHSAFSKILIILVAATIASCARTSSRLNQTIDRAEKIMSANPDSAMMLLDAIDPSELTVDSIRAKYHFLRAFGHIRQNRSMIADSLISSAHQYFRGKDIVRDMRSGTALAWYKFWVGDTPGAISLLDSLICRDRLPDSLLTQTLRVRVLLGTAEYQGHRLIPLAKKLVGLETDTFRKAEARYMLMGAYMYADKCDSALIIADSLIQFAKASHLGDKQFQFEMEKAEILGELGKYDESIAVIDDIFRKAPDNGAAHYLHLQKALSLFNAGKYNGAEAELYVADSIAALTDANESAYYLGFSRLLHTLMDYNSRGVITIRHIAEITNRQQERINRTKASQWESERDALQQHSRSLRLKAESQHKTVIILIIALVAVVILSGALWIIRQRRQRERENEERAEALQKMVNELKSAPSAAETHTPAALRRAMIQQLGIIKMVAETPTEQNREMLRKISSIGGSTNGGLVNWDNLFELIDNLYSGFHKKLRLKYGHILSPKEEQIIVLLVAGFSTKEISVITSQTTATIYVRKSSIRKKLNLPEKEDIAASLQSLLSAH